MLNYTRENEKIDTSKYFYCKSAKMNGFFKFWGLHYFDEYYDDDGRRVWRYELTDELLTAKDISQEVYPKTLTARIREANKKK